MLIISIVKSSLALSLGLVGALSIIRFRAAIKEPEELAYLFLAIGIGLGFGADQGVITLVAFIVMIIMIVVIKKFSYKSNENQNLHLTVNTQKPKQIGIEKIIKTLEANCTAVDLKRLDETGEILEATFMVEFRDFPQLNQAKKAIQSLDNNVKFTFLDNRGIL